jgi:hypothetical protein
MSVPSEAGRESPSWRKSWPVTLILAARRGSEWRRSRRTSVTHFRRQKPTEARSRSQKWWAPEELNLTTTPPYFIVRGVTVRWRERSPYWCAREDSNLQHPASEAGDSTGWPTRACSVRHLSAPDVDSGTRTRIRTGTGRILSPLALPVGLCGRRLPSVGAPGRI